MGLKEKQILTMKIVFFPPNIILLIIFFLGIPAPKLKFVLSRLEIYVERYCFIYISARFNVELNFVWGACAGVDFSIHVHVHVYTLLSV